MNLSVWWPYLHSGLECDLLSSDTGKTSSVSRRRASSPVAKDTGGKPQVHKRITSKNGFLEGQQKWPNIVMRTRKRRRTIANRKLIGALSRALQMGSSLVARGSSAVTAAALVTVWRRFDLWPRNIHVLWVWPKRKKKKRISQTAPPGLEVCSGEFGVAAGSGVAVVGGCSVEEDRIEKGGGTWRVTFSPQTVMSGFCLI